MDELEFVMRERDHLADVAYRLARRCEVMEEAAFRVPFSFTADTSLEEMERAIFAAAEAEVAKRWPR